jgi:hypothetical protein
MAFITIPASWLDVGDPTKKELFDYIKDNFDDLDSRTTAVEGATSKIIVYNGIFCNASSAGSLTGLMFERIPADFTITDAKVYIFTKGSLTGNLELDVRKSSSADFTSDSSIFSTKPKLDFSVASNYAESSNAVISSGGFTAGQYLRIDMTSLPAGGVLGKWGVYIIGEPA